MGQGVGTSALNVVTSMPKGAFLAAVWPQPIVAVEPSVSTIERVHPIIAQREGGYSNHPQDSGGPTNWGITQVRLAQARGRQVRRRSRR